MSKIKWSKVDVTSYDAPKWSKYYLDEIGQMQRVRWKTVKIGRLFYLNYEKGLWWFMIWNRYGLAGKKIKKHPLLFSERNGYTKSLKLFGWSFKILKPY